MSDQSRNLQRMRRIYLSSDEQERIALARLYKQHLHTRETMRDTPPSLGPDYRPVGYVCQLCVAARAEWPREKTHTFRFPFKLSWTVAYVTPMVCSNCRIMRQREVTRLGDGRRRFWKRVISLWIGESYPSAGPGMVRAFAYRQTLWVGVLAFRQIGQMAQQDVSRWWTRRRAAR